MASVRDIRTFIIFILFLIVGYHANAKVELTLIQTLTVPDSTHDSGFGNDIIFAKDNMYVSAPAADIRRSVIDVKKFNGRIYKYKLDQASDKWLLDGEIKSDTVKRDLRFGSKVEIDDNYMAISVHGIDSTNQFGFTKNNMGAVYMYKYDTVNNDWILSQKIMGTMAEKTGIFGDNIILKDNVLLIASSTWSKLINNQSYIEFTGKLEYYILDKTSDEWIRQGEIKFDRYRKAARLGQNMAFDGETLVLGDIGRPKEYENGQLIVDNIGVLEIYKYNKDEKTFTRREKMQPKDEIKATFYGMNPIIYKNEIYLYKMQGMDLYENDPEYINPTNMVVLSNKLDKEVEELQKIVPAEVAHPNSWNRRTVVSDKFMAIAASGDYTDSDGENEVDKTGAVHIYTRDGIGDEWRFDHKLVHSIRETGYFFGKRLALDNDKLYAVGDYIEYDRDINPRGYPWEVMHVYKIDTTTLSISTQENISTSSQITISPNPISEVTSIGLPAVGEVRVYLADITGATVREIWTGTADVPTSVMMDATSLSQGEYFVVVESAAGVISEKIVVER